jgi:hypothetical protein
MAKSRIDPAKIEIARQDFLAGTPLRELAKKHGIGLRTLSQYSKDGGWSAERSRAADCCGIDKIKKIAKAADSRARSIDQAWKDRVGLVLDEVSALVAQETALLAAADTSVLTINKRMELLEALTRSLKNLQSILPPNEGGPPPPRFIVQMNLGGPPPEGNVIDIQMEEALERGLTVSR